jgi:23S rRNA (adenine2503-C2)-methyltransferase
MTLVSPRGAGEGQSEERAAASVTKQVVGNLEQGGGKEILSAAEMQGLSIFATIDELGENLGGSGRAKLVWKSILSHQNPFEDPNIHDNTRSQLYHKFEPLPEIATKVTAADLTTKLLVRLRDGMEIESVIIPHDSRPTAQKSLTGQTAPRSTLCVSSQVGCNRACVFCATGKMGFIRQLSAHEILAQVHLARQVIEEDGLPPLHNVVFMGMGEPLNNVQHVKRAVQVIADSNCFNVGPSRITVSSVGPSPAVIRACKDMPAMLAWSVHAADEETRRRLVPTTAHSMEELRDAYLQVLESRTKHKSSFMVAVTLIEGVNDSEAHARDLCRLLQPFQHSDKCKGVVVDLIPYNDIGFGFDGEPNFLRTNQDKIRRFQNEVRKAGHACFVRVTRGDDTAAACGQLATKSTKEAQT